MDLKLYEYPEQLDRLAEMLAESGGEVTAEIQEFSDSLELGLNEKLAGYIAVLKKLEILADATKGEGDRLKELERIRRSAVSGIKTFVMIQLRKMGYDKVETPRGNLAICRNFRPSIEWEGPGEIPREYIKTVIEDREDKDRMYRDWVAGKLPEGFRVTHGEHLRVR